MLERTPVYRFFNLLDRLALNDWAVPTAVLLALLFRLIVGLASYSGYGVKPMHGDYEAQRHWYQFAPNTLMTSWKWMELTVHLPPSQWYYYDHQYWGLDYPPLTAYVSWFFGKIAHFFDPKWVALFTSRGIETPESKVFMRWTVVAADLAVYIPAVYYFCKRVHSSDVKMRNTAILILLLQPALIIIDHGHFQYNGVMLGFTLASLALMMNESYLLGSVAFCLSLGFKQMALYYAPAIFAFLLGKCWQSQHGFKLFFKLGATVVATFIALLLPWIHSPTEVLQILHRLFPFQRGLFEDKVANVWCAINVIVKLREHLDQGTLLNLSFICTLVSILPACLDLGLKPSIRRLVYATGNCSLGFFLFSFQVHEKSILIPALPVTLIVAMGDKMDVACAGWFINVAMFSMYPLLKKDGLTIQYICLIVLWNWLGSFWSGKGSPLLFKFASRASYLVMLFIHTSEIFLQPPKRYPDLYPVVNAIFSVGHFGLFYLYLVYRQVHSNQAVVGHAPRDSLSKKQKERKKR